MAERLCDRLSKKPVRVLKALADQYGLHYHDREKKQKLVWAVAGAMLNDVEKDDSGWSYEDFVGWREAFDDKEHESFDPCEVPPGTLPVPVLSHYQLLGRRVARAFAFPGPKRQIYGRPIKPLIYLLCERDDGVRECWAKLPHPSLRGEKPYFQIDRKVKLNKAWKF